MPVAVGSVVVGPWVVGLSVVGSPVGLPVVGPTEVGVSVVLGSLLAVGSVALPVPPVLPAVVLLAVSVVLPPLSPQAASRAREHASKDRSRMG